MGFVASVENGCWKKSGPVWLYRLVLQPHIHRILFSSTGIHKHLIVRLYLILRTVRSTNLITRQLYVHLNLNHVYSILCSIIIHNIFMHTRTNTFSSSHSISDALSFLTFLLWYLLKGSVSRDFRPPFFS